MTPALFTQIGYLIGDGLPPEKLESLLRDAGEIKPEADWAALDAAHGDHRHRGRRRNVFQALNPGYVLAGGLLDGINPCAFATIIFLLSYLKIARRSPREILAVGSAFIIAVFLTYLLIGLALNEMLGWVGQLAGARRILNWVFAGFALVIALLSLRDAWRAAHGRLGDMSLQMPQFLKDRVRSVVRTGARSSRFVIAAFAVGVAITFLELACTGQVYAPIVYAIRQGRASAVGYLLLYNLAFIAPLVIIFAPGISRNDQRPTSCSSKPNTPP